MRTLSRDSIAQSLRQSAGAVRHVAASWLPAAPAPVTSTIGTAGVISNVAADRITGRRLTLLRLVALAALLVSLLDFALIVGAVPLPVPGLRYPGQQTAADTATFGFEHPSDGWSARGAALNATISDTRVFAGHSALEFQVQGLATTTRAFVYKPLPPVVRPGSWIVAHIYLPASAPPIVATVYVLDGAWAWMSGQFPALLPGQWTAVAYQVPTQARSPIRELGVMLVGTKGYPPYTGSVVLDSVDVR